MERVYTTPLLDKLGVHPGSRVALIGQTVTERWFRELLSERTASIIGAPTERCDLVFLAADTHDELACLATLARRIEPAGAIWVVSRKGRAATLRDIEVIVAAKDAGLVDNKVASFSETHTALRLVVPVAGRRR